jgi:hypothetical protein
MTDKQVRARELGTDEGEFSDWLWAAPPLLMLTAKGAYTMSDAWWGTALAVVLAVLSGIGFAAVIVIGIRRRAYETLITLALGAGVFCALAHLKGQL